MLLEVDGITGQWEGDTGCFDFENESERLPFALQRLTNPRLYVRLTNVPQGPVSSNKRVIRTSYTSILKLRLGRSNPVRLAKIEFRVTNTKELSKT